MRREDLVAFGTTFVIFSAVIFAITSFSGFISSQLSCMEKCKVNLQACTVKTCIKTQEIKAVKKTVKKPLKKRKELVKKEPKPIIKKEKPLTKKVALKEPIKEKVVKEEKPLEKLEEGAKEQEEVVAQKAVKKTVEAKVKKQTLSAAVMDARNRFFKRIKEEINSNKRYPRKALRRSIESDVKVQFTIFADGSIKINQFKGHRFFKDNSEEALMDTFPVNIPKELQLTFPLDLSVDIKYRIS